MSDTTKPSDTAKPSNPANPDPDKSDFEFIGWSKLATSDPVAFESMREQAIEDFIQSVPKSKQQHLRCLQWRIDQTRKLSKNPMDACIKLSQLMMESVHGENGLINAMRGLHREVNGNTTARPNNQIQRQKAKILPLALLTQPLNLGKNLP